MLYSYKNQYPQLIPYRITLPNGSTRTDPSTFTSEEIALAGYAEVEDPPEISQYQSLIWNGTQRVVRDWNQQEIDAFKQQQQEEKVAKYDKALTDYLDSVAQQRRYDNRITCALRAGYVGPYQQEGIAFAQWMDECNSQAYRLMYNVLEGLAVEPTVEEFLSSLPAIQWPD